MMKLYISKKEKISEIFEYNNEKKIKKILYMFKSSELKDTHIVLISLLK